MGCVAQLPRPADQRAETVGREVTGVEVLKASFRLSNVPQTSAADPNWPDLATTIVVEDLLDPLTDA